MSVYSFEQDAELASTGAWRPLDCALAHWVRAHGGSAQLATVAAWASLADGMGDSALPLLGDAAGRHGMPPLSADTVAALRGEALVGAGESAQPTAFVLDAQGRFALWRNHAHEVRIAECIERRRGGPGHPLDAALRDDLDRLFEDDRADSVRRQRDAVAAVAGRRLFVLTGGPGTGKTTTVLRMLLMLQRRCATALAIEVAAPTGKAAQRLVQSLRQGKSVLATQAAKPLPIDWQPLLARIPDREALTVHRLLGFDPRRNLFTRGAANPIAADVVVVDEASMLDLGMLRTLLDALRPEATLILVGDADQLTSIGAGSVLMDLVAALEIGQAPELVRLEHSFRAERALVPINAAVREGDHAALVRAFAESGAPARFEHVDSVPRLRRRLDAWADGLARLAIRPVLEAAPAASAADQRERIAQCASDAALAALRALSQRQLLCALREDVFGSLAANHAIEQRLRRAWNVPADQVWYAGRAILITRNDYAARLFNGDIGLAIADASGDLRVWFETTLADGRSAARALSPGRLPPHEGAFAITIHKSQGSEYAHAAVLLPPDPDNRILSRQLLYTGLSRARHELDLWATDAAVAAALARPILRAGGLAARLTGTTSARSTGR